MLVYRKPARRILMHRGRSVSIWLIAVIWSLALRKQSLFANDSVYYLPTYLANLINSLDVYHALGEGQE